jgi:hypothetical protein
MTSEWSALSLGAVTQLPAQLGLEPNQLDCRSGRPHQDDLRQHSSTFREVSDDRRLLTAPELDAMTPDQRAAAVGERIVTNLDELPAEFRQRVLDTGARLAAERRESE